MKRVEAKTASSGATVLKPRIKTISAGGLQLGVHRKEVERLFVDPVSGGWKLEEEKKTPDIHQMSYRKTIVLENGDEFCDRIEISLYFDAQSKLSGLDVLSGGCFDGPCVDQ